jgi:hypothetical protein
MQSLESALRRRDSGSKIFFAPKSLRTGAATATVVTGREGADCRGGAGAWCGCVGSGARGRDPCESAVSVAPELCGRAGAAPAGSAVYTVPSFISECRFGGIRNSAAITCLVSRICLLSDITPPSNMFHPRSWRESIFLRLRAQTGGRAILVREHCNTLRGNVAKILYVHKLRDGAVN